MEHMGCHRGVVLFDLNLGRRPGDIGGKNKGSCGIVFFGCFHSVSVVFIVYLIDPIKDDVVFKGCDKLFLFEGEGIDGRDEGDKKLKEAKGVHFIDSGKGGGVESFAQIGLCSSVQVVSVHKVVCILPVEMVKVGTLFDDCFLGAYLTVFSELSKRLSEPVQVGEDMSELIDIGEQFRLQ